MQHRANDDIWAVTDPRRWLAGCAGTPPSAARNSPSTIAGAQIVAQEQLQRHRRRWETLAQQPEEGRYLVSAISLHQQGTKKVMRISVECILFYSVFVQSFCLLQVAFLVEVLSLNISPSVELSMQTSLTDIFYDQRLQNNTFLRQCACRAVACGTVCTLCQETKRYHVGQPLRPKKTSHSTAKKAQPDRCKTAVPSSAFRAMHSPPRVLAPNHPIPAKQAPAATRIRVQAWK